MFSVPAIIPVPISVTIHATSINIIAKKTVAPLVKKSFPNVEITTNTKNDINTPISIPITAFPMICHPDGCGGSILNML